MLQLHIDNTFSEKLPADPDRSNSRRQVPGAAFSYVTPRVPSQPRLLHVSDVLLSQLGLTQTDAQSEAFTQIFSGAQVLKGTDPYAMNYGGHQFGHWAGQLGDGRAINLTEIVHEGERWTLQLKGAGPTPYSRRADGLAVLRSSVREHLCSEAMYHLGVPTTRSLCLLLTGDEVLRDVMYDGHPALEKGAVVCRVAPSFIRFGNFQIFTAREDIDNLRKLADYTIQHFFPDIQTGSQESYVEFFAEVARRTLDMIIHWQRVGFVHGVMNTDNMSILGLTIDYGPYGWLEGYDPNWTPNTTDKDQRRYRFGQQPAIALWNLAQLGSALVPLVGEPAPLQAVLDQYQTDFPPRYTDMMRRKLGLLQSQETDIQLIREVERLLSAAETDMTIFYRQLSAFAPIEKPEVDPLSLIQKAFYQEEQMTSDLKKAWQDWFAAYATRLQAEASDRTIRQQQMNAANPKYVLRNYMAQLAIDAADEGHYALIDELYQMLKSPYAEQPQYDKWYAKRPEWARHKVGCSMLSCSS